MLVMAILELYDMYLSIYLYGFLAIVYSLVISYLVFFENLHLCNRTITHETYFQRKLYWHPADVFSFSIYY